MKTIENKKFKIEGKDNSYGDMLKSCVSLPPQGGFSLEDIEKRLRILSAVNDKEIKLEDADYNLAMECILKMRWGILDKAIIEFRDDFKAAKSK